MGEPGPSCNSRNMAGTGSDVYAVRSMENQIRKLKQQRQTFLVATTTISKALPSMTLSYSWGSLVTEVAGKNLYEKGRQSSVWIWSAGSSSLSSPALHDKSAVSSVKHFVQIV